MSSGSSSSSSSSSDEEHFQKKKHRQMEKSRMTMLPMNLNENDSMPTESNALNRETRSFKPYRSEKELSLQITTILDALLFDSGYDRQIRPQIDQIDHGPPLEVLLYCILAHV